MRPRRNHFRRHQIGWNFEQRRFLYVIVFNGEEKAGRTLYSYIVILPEVVRDLGLDAFRGAREEMLQRMENPMLVTRQRELEDGEKK